MEGGTTIDTTVASNALQSLVTSVQTYISACAPYLVTLLGAALGITLIWVAWKWLKRGTNKA